ncbi:MAG: GTPase HflX [Rubrobacter sp.]|nr:GTPase HflX [Rubrobacter sp.]
MTDSLKALLVGAGENRQMAELGRLVETLGYKTVGRLEQARRDGSGYVGKGKREELASLVEETGADVVVTDDELTASTARVLERAAGKPVLDRTALIIRIFESHARDAASRLEVELANLEYRLPRVKGGSEALSRLGGGGDTTRGPGEQKLEYDRRVIRDRISALNHRLQEEKSAREVRGRRRREGLGPPSVALVGYTNAGKTTILNSLSGAGRSTRDRLFETLETTTRLVEGGGAHENDQDGADNSESRPDFVVTDTVGFIQKLPTQLVHSFASTLEAAAEADVVVVCADASSEELNIQISTVLETLRDILPDESPMSGDDRGAASGYVLCLNKMDLVEPEKLGDLDNSYSKAVRISALSDTSALRDRIQHEISRSRTRLDLRVPHSDYAVVGKLYGIAEIHSTSNNEDGVILDVTLPISLASRYEKYAIDSTVPKG